MGFYHLPFISIFIIYDIDVMGLTTLFLNFTIISIPLCSSLCIYIPFIPYYDNSMEAGSNQWPWQDLFVFFCG